MFSTIKDLFKYDKRFLFGFLLIIILLFLFILSFFSPYPVKSWNVVARDQSPSLKYLLGTNSIGQDIFWVLTYAIRNSLLIGFGSAILSRGIAIPIGLIAGYKGGFMERVLMTLTDSFMVLPLLPILIMVSAMLRGKTGIFGLIIILGMFGWAYETRLFKSMILSLREREFTYTAIYSGMNTSKVILTEHLPFILPLIMASTLNNMIWAIGMEVVLAIFGLVSLEIPTLGTMINWAIYYQAILRSMWNWIFAPITASILLFLSLYLLSTSISEYIDPRSRVERITIKR